MFPLLLGVLLRRFQGPCLLLYAPFRCLWPPLLSTSAPLLRLTPHAPHGTPFHLFVPGPSASAGPPQSSFAFAADEAFDPGLADPSAPEPEVPVPSSVSDSVGAEIRCMYAYLADLFPQAAGSPSDAPPPRTLFEDFFAAGSPSNAPPPRTLFEDFFAVSTSPHQPVFLAWFERVCTALAEADTRLASMLTSGRVDASILPQQVSQYAVRGEFASGAAVPVNPSLLSMFERLLRPSLQLGILLREAALLESSSRFHSEALSHSLWLLSGVLAFDRFADCVSRLETPSVLSYASPCLFFGCEQAGNVGGSGSMC